MSRENLVQIMQVCDNVREMLTAEKEILPSIFEQAVMSHPKVSTHGEGLHAGLPCLWPLL